MKFKVKENEAEHAQGSDSILYATEKQVGEHQ